MLYDWREIIYKEILVLDENDENYFYKRFKRLKVILSKKDQLHLDYIIDSFKVEFELQRWPLMRIEQIIKTHKGMRCRGEFDIKMVSSQRILNSLKNIDDWCDTKIRELGREIRFSSMTELSRAKT